MKLGEICKYMPTSTVGKVTDMRSSDGRDWAMLDTSGLWYDVTKLTPADKSEYKEISYKYIEKEFSTGLKSIEDMAREIEEVNISEFTPSGGG